MLLYLHNPDFYATSHLARYWSTNHANAQVVSGGYNSTNALTASALGASVTRFMRRQQENQHFAVGCRFKVSSYPASAQILLGVIEDSGVVQTCVSLGTDGTLTIWRGAMTTSLAVSTAAVALNSWHRLGFKGIISKSAGDAEVHLNSTKATQNVVVRAGSVNTSQSDAVGWHGLYVGLGSGILSGHYYAVDGYGPVTGLLHGGVVRTNYPSTAGAYDEWAKTGGTLPQVLDDTTPDDDTTRIDTDAFGERYAVVMSALAAALHVHGVQLTATVRNYTGTGFSPSQELLARVGSLDYYDAWQSVPSASWLGLWRCWEVNPETNLPWLIPEINASEWGGRVQP